MVNAAAKKLKIVKSSNGLNKYFHQLHNYCLLLGINRKEKNSEINLIYQIIIGLQEVCEFDSLLIM